MSTLLLVTTSQVESVRKMANEKRVGRARFQKALNDGRVARLLDEIKADGIIAPKGARIHILRVTVKLDEPWHEAANAAGPDTPSNCHVHQVGDLYLPTGTGEEKQEHILLNYPNGDGSWDKALSWAESKGLKRTVPRAVFAIGKQHPRLHRRLGINPMYVEATTECTFEGRQRACAVWWLDSEREAVLLWVSNFDNARGWFSFRKSSVSDAYP